MQLPVGLKRQELEAAGDDAGTVCANLDAEFGDLKESRVCMSVGEYQRNAYGIALPIVVGRTRTLMALNGGAVELEPDMTAIRRRVTPELKAAALTLSSVRMTSTASLPRHGRHLSHVVELTPLTRHHLLTVAYNTQTLSNLCSNV